MNELRSADKLQNEPRRSSRHTFILLILVAALCRLAWVLFSYHLDLGARRHHLESAWILFAAIALLVVLFRAPPDANTAASGKSGFSSAWLLAAMVPSFILYWPSLSIGLLSDDFVLLQRGPFVEGWDFFRPLPLAVWQVIVPAAGATGLHLLNVGLHGINAWLLFRLLLISGVRAHVAGIVAALFLTFPAAVEPVAWSSGIFDVGLVCCGLMYLMAVTRQTVSSRAAGALALACALLTKETAVSLPIMALVLGLRVRIDRALVWGSIAVVAAYGLVRVVSGLDLPGVQGPASYVIKEIIARPFAALALPWTTREISGAPLLLALGPQLALAALVAGYAGSPRVSRRAVVPFLWILAAVAPVYGLFLVGDDLSGSRYLYLPLVGWCVLVADLIEGQPVNWGRRLGSAFAIVAVIIGVLGVRAHLRPWQNAAALRDSVLQEAGAAVRRSNCAEITFQELPDNVDGAFVFRNGFSDALTARFGLTPSPSAPPGCTFGWSGTSFSTR